MYFHIKVFVDVDEAENTLQTFFISIVFLGQSQSVFLISALYYAYSMFEIVEST